MNISELPILKYPWRKQVAEPPTSRRLKAFLAFSVLLALAFSRPLIALVTHAFRTDIHSHIVLIPFISAYLIYVRRKELPLDYVCTPGWASLLLAAGFVTSAAAAGLFPNLPPLTQNDSLSMMTLSFICFFAAGGFLVLGRKWMAAAAFPFAFLVFMIPLPDRVVEWLETASKLASAEAAALLFSVAGMPVLRDGVVFQLPGIVIQVAQECSGIRSSWVLSITSILASYLFLQTPWRRTVLVSSVIPLAILRNGFRIFVIGLLCVQFGPQWINSGVHHHGGPLFFALSLVPLFLLLWWLRSRETSEIRRPQVGTTLFSQGPRRE